MPRGTIDWKSTESYTRLLAAVVASQDMKLNYHKIATMYGNGATYDAIEGRFRVIKKEAAVLKHEIDSKQRDEAPPRGSNPSTPRKRTSRSQAGVISGRVTKTASGGVARSKTSSQTTVAGAKVALTPQLGQTSSDDLPSSSEHGDDSSSFNTFPHDVGGESFEDIVSLGQHGDTFLVPGLMPWDDDDIVV